MKKKKEGSQAFGPLLLDQNTWLTADDLNRAVPQEPQLFSLQQGKVRIGMLQVRTDGNDPKTDAASLQEALAVGRDDGDLSDGDLPVGILFHRKAQNGPNL